MRPIYTADEYEAEINSLKNRIRYYANRHQAMKADVERYKQLYKNANESRNIYKKKCENLPMGYRKKPYNLTRNLMGMNLSYGSVYLQHLMPKFGIPFTHYQLLTICYNHEFMTNFLLRRNYHQIWRHMKRIDIKLKFLEAKGLIKFVGEYVKNKESIFMITTEGRIFVEKINKSLFTNIMKHGCGVDRKKAKEKDPDNL